MVTINPDRLTAGETARDDFQSPRIRPGLAESGHEHRAVDDEEIRITRRHALPVKAEGARHGQLDDVEFFSGRGTKRFQPFEIRREDGVVFLLRIWFHAGDEAIGFVEAGHVVDVTVRVVADNALAEPENLVRPEIFFQGLLDLRPVQLGIAVGVEQALLAGEQEAFAIHVDRSAFEHHVVHETAQTGDTLDARRDLVVEIVGRIFVAPSVVGPIGQRDLAGGGVFDKNRPVVAAPSVVGGVVVE